MAGLQYPSMRMANINIIDDLRKFFEVNYGPVLNVLVIGSPAGDQMQSRGFGFITFKHAASVSAAVKAHYMNIYGKKVEIKGAVRRSELSALEVSRADSDTPKDSDIAMTANKMLDLNEAEVLEVATPDSFVCQSMNSCRAIRQARRPNPSKPVLRLLV